MNRAIVVQVNEKPRILVVAALARELAPLAGRGLEGVILLTLGVGRINCERRLRDWLEHDRAEAVVCLGYAGALSTSLAVADLVIDKTGWAPSLNELSSSSVHFGKVITVDEIVGAKGKRDLAARLDANEIACVEMESAAVAQVCHEQGIPYLLIRAISDLFDEDFPIDFNRCRDENGEVSGAKVMKAVLRRPQSIKPLIELSRRAERCAERLAGLVEQLLPALRKELASGRREAGT